MKKMDKQTSKKIKQGMLLIEKQKKKMDKQISKKIKQVISENDVTIIVAGSLESGTINAEFTVTGKHQDITLSLVNPFIRGIADYIKDKGWDDEEIDSAYSLIEQNIIEEFRRKRLELRLPLKNLN